MKILLIVLAACAASVSAISYAVYRIVFYSPHRNQNDIYRLPSGEQYLEQRELMLQMIGGFASRQYERIEIPSYDGLILVGRYYHLLDHAPLVICFHGYRATAVRDFCGGGEAFLRAGCNVLLVDQRAQGESGGHTITFGAKESKDCLSWVRYSVKRFGGATRIVLSGVSMGASTVLMAKDSAMPIQVRGIIADSPFSSASEIIGKVCADMKLPWALIRPFVFFAARIFGRFSLRDASVSRSAGEAAPPVLIIHGEDDRFVPCEMSRRIAGNSPQIRLEVFPNAGHGLSYMADAPRYESLLKSFLDQVLIGPVQ